MYELIRNINTRLSDPALLSDMEQDRILAQMNSYLGLLSHTESYRLRSKMIQLLHQSFFSYFLVESPYMIVSIKPK
jgi:hypothetical protein